MSDDELVQQRQGATLVLRLNRPDARNALTPSLMKAIGTAVIQAEQDDDTRALVLTGAGDRAFCGGMDLRSFAGGEDMTLDDEAGLGFRRLMSGDVALPVIGAANGSAVAGGLELLLGCDVVVLAQGARLGLPEVQRGLIPGGGGTFLGTRIPLAVALELVLTGELIDAERALAVGLVNIVVPGPEVLPRALAYAERMAANGPLSVRAAKELVRLAVTDAPAAEQRLAQLSREVFASADAREGALAFVEKRAPQWQGR